MLNRRSLLSSLLLPAAVGSGLVAAGKASGRSPGREFVGVDSWFNTDQPLVRCRAARQPVTGRVRHLHLHQLAADIAVRQALAFRIWAAGPADRRGPYARVFVRAHARLHRRSAARAWGFVPDGAGQRIQDLARL